MALPLLNSPMMENQSVRGRRPTENRQLVEVLDDKPKIESFKIFAGLATPEVVVNIVAGGKTISLKGNRRTIMKILKEAAEAAFNTEPGT